MDVLSGILKRRETSLSEEKSSKPPDYDDYRMERKDIAVSFARAAVIILGTAELCYNSLWAAVLLLPYIPWYLKVRKEELKEKRKWELNLQFGDMIRSLSAVLESGYSVENALTEAYNDLKLTYDDNAMIMKELKI